MRPITLLLILPLLAGCSEWRRLTSFDEPASRPAPRVAVAAPTPAPAPIAAPAGPPPNAFCLAVARQDSAGNGFDPATQQRVAVRSYQQCAGLFGNPP